MKLIIDIPDPIYEWVKNTGKFGLYHFDTLMNIVKNGTPLDSDSERAEVQAYFAGEAYGWEQGRKALIDDVKAEIEDLDYFYDNDYFSSNRDSMFKCNEVMQILDNIGKAESEDT